MMRDWKLRVDDLPTPTPGPGQVLTKVLAVRHLRQRPAHGQARRGDRVGDQTNCADGPTRDPTRRSDVRARPRHRDGPRVLLRGRRRRRGCREPAGRRRRRSMPVAFDATGVHPLGFSNRYPGGYADHDGDQRAARRSRCPTGSRSISPRSPSRSPSASMPWPRRGIVVGRRGDRARSRAGRPGVHRRDEAARHRPDRRRRLLARSPGARRARSGATTSSIRTTSRRSMRGAAHRRRKPLVIFEAVGVPGMIEQAMRMAPKDSRILIVGACMQEDHIHPMLGIGRELDAAVRARLRASTSSPASLDAIADGARRPVAVDHRRRSTIDGVPQAFADLGNPEAHAKILVEPVGARPGALSYSGGVTDTFPRQYARTQRLTLGEPRNVTVSPDGRRVVFLRSSHGSDPVNSLWVLDAATGDERLVADPRVLLAADGDDDEPAAEERARRERAREGAGGITSYATDASCSVVAFALGGRLFAGGLLSGQARAARRRRAGVRPAPRPARPPRRLRERRDAAHRRTRRVVAGARRRRRARHGHLGQRRLHRRRGDGPLPRLLVEPRRRHARRVPGRHRAGRRMGASPIRRTPIAPPPRSATRPPARRTPTSRCTSSASTDRAPSRLGSRLLPVPRIGRLDGGRAS